MFWHCLQTGLLLHTSSADTRNVMTQYSLFSLLVAKQHDKPILKRTRLEAPPLLITGHTLEQVECFKYLGLLLTSDLSWSPHIETACSKARKLLGMIYRRFSKHSSPDTLLHLYESIVRPHLEYASQVWDPYLQKDIKLLEGVQKFALRVCSKNYDNSYEDLLDTFQLPELSTRRLYLRLSLLFKIVHESYHFPPNILIPMSSTLRYAKPYTCIASHLHTQTLSITHLCPTLFLIGMLCPVM